ncbi:MAG TPA: hypothetical protein PKL97_09370 [Candidatus Omnitrophota bacterium]|nr:hypothetical protein [Candidatus Omnitrophota bacterium]
MNKYVKLVVLFFLVTGLLSVSAPAFAKTAKEIDAGAASTLDSFKAQVADANNLLQEAKGVLVFPDLMKVGFGLGGEYGEGVLQINGKSVEYYSSVGGSFGMQLGGQTRRVLYLFMDEAVLSKFRSASGWVGGVNASGVFLKTGIEDFINTLESNKPIMTFVMDQRGLMFNLNAEVSKLDETKK